MIRKILNRKKINPEVPIYTGIGSSEKIQFQLFSYNVDEYHEDKDFSANEFNRFLSTEKRYWLNAHGIHDAEKIEGICEKLGIHPLTIQDILDVNQRPKFQEYDNYLFFSLKSILPSNENEIALSQLSFVLGKYFLVSFQEKKGDHFDHVRQRIRYNLGILRERGADYLLFLLLESILDNYFKTVHNIEVQSEKLGVIDTEKDPSPDLLKKIEIYKQNVNQVKKTIIPIKEFVTKIEREQFCFIDQKHLKYFYELKDLCLSLIDECHQIELSLESSINLFFSIQGHRMNQVMKTLTIVSTIFIPLTFIAGIYGMNFLNIPELKWKWGYAGVWIVIVIVFIGMIIFFKKKKWF